MHKRVGVIMGGFTRERHVSLESGRNVYSKLVASTKYLPVPLFLSGSKTHYRIFTLPVSLLLKDNADDIHDILLNRIRSTDSEAFLDTIRQQALVVTNEYAKNAIFVPEELHFAQLKEKIDFMFIALHGRPGEDGTLQAILESHGIPYNGSGIATTALTIDKYATNQFLAQKGFQVAKQHIVTKKKWLMNSVAIVDAIEAAFSYPIIAKPVDDGCSSGVMRITDKVMLMAYASSSFRDHPFIGSDLIELLHLQTANDIPQQERFLVESFINNDSRSIACLEITVGLSTHLDYDGTTVYTIFEPSETLAADAILSLEEKFLAGEGHNITPARFHNDPILCTAISKSVKKELRAIAKALDIEGYGRIDAFVKIYPNHKTEVWIVEVNALPAMTPATCIFHQSALSGYTPFEFIDSIIEYGLTKKNFTIY